MRLFVSVVFLALAGCATGGGQSAQQNIAGVCQGIASAEQAVALVKDKLTPAQKTLLAHAVAVKAPVCNVAPYPTSIDAAAYAALSGALGDLTRIKQGVSP